jgi:hypothetical protein
MSISREAEAINSSQYLHLAPCCDWFIDFRENDFNTCSYGKVVLCAL